MHKANTTGLVTVTGKTIGEIVAEDFRVAEVFAKAGIDFCCGGQILLEDACREKGLNLASILQAIEAAQETPLDRGQNYASWDLPFLADYIINTHHAYLNENTAQIAAYARKIAEVHGSHHPEAIEVAAVFDKIAADMAGHLQEEEEVLFPAVKRIAAASKAGVAADRQDRETLKASLRKLDQEHEEIGEATHTIRRLTRDYEIPADVCNTFVVTYRKLQEFEEDLHKHVHLENNILFPKAARL